jgi:hypothetical protein
MPEGAGYGVIWGGFNLRLKAEMTPKPSYVSTAVVTRQLSGAKFVRREKTQGWIRSYLFRKGEEDIRVLWGTRPGTVTIKANSPLTLTDMMGERELLYPKDGEAYLTLSGSPLYVQGRIDEIIAGGKISVTGETEVATGDEIPVKFLFDNSLSAKSFSGELEVEGKQLLFGAKGGGKSAETVSVPAERAGERNIIYRVKVDNRLIGKGVLTTRIRDPLAVTAVLTAKGGLGIKVINDSKTTEYVISSVNWRVYRRMGTSDRNVLLLPGKKETIRIPTPWVQTSQVYPVSVNVTFKTGAPLVFSGELKASP